MDTHTLICCLRKISVCYFKKNKKKLYYFVLPCDLLPKKVPTKNDTMIIVNTGNSSSSGLHWQGIWLSSKCYFFDSYGRKPTNVFIKRFIEQNSKKIHYNPQRLQGYFSLCCGEYCCLFLLSQSKNIPMKKFLKSFNRKNFKSNDKKAVKLFNLAFSGILDKKKQKCSKISKQTCKSYDECKKMCCGINNEKI